MFALAALIALAAVLVAACELLPAPGPGQLDGTGWRAVEVGGQPPVAGTEPTVVFDDGRIGGSTGCNGYGGEITITGGSVRVGEIASTLIGCEAAIAETEERFLRILRSAHGIATRPDGMLVLVSRDGSVVLRPDQSVVP